MASKRAMVIGHKGQDGSFMVDLLESMDYEIYPISRNDHIHAALVNSMDEIYNFSGVSSVISPFEDVDGLIDDTKLAIHILKSISGTKTRFFQASSSLMYGDSNDLVIYGENSFAPKYPYGAAKLFIHNLINEYRQACGAFAVSGILFPHASERQKDHFFIKKVCKAAAGREKIEVGNLDHVRDYGYAPEYMKVAHWMLQQDEPKDRVIGTGYLYKLKDFVKWAFEFEDLDYKDYVIENPNDNRDEISICAGQTFYKGYITHGKELINVIMNKLNHGKII